MEYWSICLKTAFIAEGFCTKFFVVVADAVDMRGRIYGKDTVPKIALYRYVSPYLHLDMRNHNGTWKQQATDP